MQPDSILILLGIIAIIGVVLYKRPKQETDTSAQNMLLSMQQMREELMRATSDQRREVQQQLDRVSDQLNKGLGDSHQSIQKQFSLTSKLIQDVTQQLTEHGKTNQQVLDYSAQLQDLQQILKNPKQRGVLGEYWLETLLGNVLPAGAYQMQYMVGVDEKLNQKLIADAVIFIRNLVIPIDAKFSLENYNRMMQETDSDRRDKIEKEFKADVKKRIDETSKYIRPEFNTMGFAFMFIPAEGVYYNLLNAEVGSGVNSSNLMQYAFDRKVMIVSPTSLFAYLQTVLMGLRELQLEESTQEIIKRVGELGKHFRAFADYHERMGKNLTTVVGQYNQSTSELRKMSRDVVKITDGSREDIIELDDVAKPMAIE